VLDYTLTSDCTITYYYIGNYPINYINASYPISLYNLIGYQIISSVDTQYITIKLTNQLSLTDSINLTGTWNTNTFSTGGSNIQIALITNIVQGYKSPSNYKIELNNKIDNIACIKFKSSEIPNTEKVIYNITLTDANNYFYWENAIDNYISYNIVVPPGNYTYSTLKHTMEKLISEVPRTFIANLNYSTNIYPFNNMTVEFNTNTGTSTFKSYNKYIVPNCLYSLTSVPDTLNWIITINQPGHNLQVGDTVYISGSLNYQTIYAELINISTGHKVLSVENNNFYTILLTNVNLITNPTILEQTSTNGGNNITILTSNSFKLDFSSPDTMGDVLGFKYTGTPIAVTPYSIPTNNYQITNTQPYIYDVDTLLLVNNNQINLNSSNYINLQGYSYILLQATNLNKCSNPNGIDYFYKILLNGSPGSILFNTFVDNPVYFNPPLKYISDFEFTFLDPNGNEFNFYGIDHSFTLEITNMSNYPENTNIPSNMARI
jgi:hypothetical protein